VLGDITALTQSFAGEGGCCICVVRSPRGGRILNRKMHI